MAPVRWSELPLDHLTSIGTRLDNRIDVLLFRSVCSSWRNSIPPFSNCYTVDSSLNISLIVPHTNGQLAGKKNLVESARELIMVERFFNKTWYDEENGVSVTETSGGNEMESWFRVYKLDEEEHKWVEVTNVGDMMLFVGKDCCFSVCASDVEEFNCRGNCIFFVDEYYMLFDNNYHDQYDELRLLGEMEIGVFNLEDSSVGPLVYFPGSADLFWPPPSWFAPDSSSPSLS